MSRHDLNTVIVAGNLTQDPELRRTPGGASVTTLRLACNRQRRRANNETVEKVNFFDVSVWGRQAENCCQFLRKGSRVTIEGELEWRQWETHEGQKRQAVEVLATTVHFEGRPAAQQDSAPRQAAAPTVPSAMSPSDPPLPATASAPAPAVAPTPPLEQAPALVAQPQAQYAEPAQSPGDVPFSAVDAALDAMREPADQSPLVAVPAGGPAQDEHTLAAVEETDDPNALPF
jgi:single-strand DNA-binding protein